MFGLGLGVRIRVRVLELRVTIVAVQSCGFRVAHDTKRLLIHSRVRVRVRASGLKL